MPQHIDPNLERLQAIAQLYGGLVEPQQRQEEQKNRQMMEMLSLALQAHLAQQHQAGEDRFHGEEADWHRQQVSAQQEERTAALNERKETSKARMEAGQHGYLNEFLSLSQEKQREASLAAPDKYGGYYHNVSQADVGPLATAVRQLYANPDMKDTARQAGLSGLVAQHRGAADLLDWTEESLYGKKKEAPLDATTFQFHPPPPPDDSLAHQVGQYGHTILGRMGTGVETGAKAVANYTAIPLYNLLSGLFNKPAHPPLQYPTP